MIFRRRRNLVAQVALLAASLTSGIGALRLTTLPGSRRVLLPVIATVLAGLVVSSVADRLSRHDRARSQLLALLSSVIVVWLVTLWTTVWSATRDGLPTLTTLRVVHERLAEAGSVITSTPTPLPPTVGIVICFAAGAGLVMAGGYALWRWKSSRSQRSAASLYTLVPSFGLFCYASLLSSDRNRFAASVAYACAAVAFLAVADLPAAATKTTATRSFRVSQNPNGDPRRPGPILRVGVASGLVSACGAIVSLLLASSGLSGMSLDALPFPAEAVGPVEAGLGLGSSSSSSGPFGPAQNVVSLDLIDDLGGFLTLRSQEVMFSAKSTVPTYWQVGTLTSFEGTGWVPDEATELAARQPYITSPASETGLSPTLPALPAPVSQKTYSVTVSLAGLGGSLLPVPPSTISVAGPVTLVPGIGAIYRGTAPRSSSTKASKAPTYSATAQVPGNSNSATASPPAQSQLAPYLSLPKQPANIVGLAHQIAAGSVGPAAQATALARWFDASGLFRYTLDPPVARGTDPLSSFLFFTRAGFCQQFAAAFAVLARLDGLPTRLAVGFTAGTPFAKSIKAGSKGAALTSYRVTGADAHVWPEVYLGPAQGWVSFEPTPPVNDEPSGIGVVSGSATSSQSALPVTTAPSVTAPSTPAPAASTGHARNALGGGPWNWLWGSLAVVILAFFAVLGFLARRNLLPVRIRARLGGRRARAAGPGSLVLARFDTAQWALRRVGLGRDRGETLAEHAARVRAAPERALAETYEALARIAERASYSGDPCTEQDADEASRLSDMLRRDVRTMKTRRSL